MEETPRLKVLSLNIHKGFSTDNRRFVLGDLREAIRGVGADLVFLQEVQGEHHHHQQRVPDWPDESQYEYLADQIWSDFAYGRNSVYPHGHHGNALLSKFPIQKWQNLDVSANRLDNRGILWCEVGVPGPGSRVIHTFCVHFGLLVKFRKYQLDCLKEILRGLRSEDAIIVSGDFNDWNYKIGRYHENELGLTECFQFLQKSYARTFPSFFPLFRLDRTYVRGFDIESAHVLHQGHWNRLSDHLPIESQLRLRA